MPRPAALPAIDSLSVRLLPQLQRPPRDANWSYLICPVAPSISFLWPLSASLCSFDAGSVLELYARSQHPGASLVSIILQDPRCPLWYPRPKSPSRPNCIPECSAEFARYFGLGICKASQFKASRNPSRANEDRVRRDSPAVVDIIFFNNG